MNARIEHLTTLTVELGAVYDVGPVPGGHRRVISITGGVMAGPVLNGEILPGGADWNTQRPDGSAEFWARYTVRTDDGVTIGVLNAGVAPSGFEPGGVATTPVLEAPDGPYAWLRSTTLVGTVSPVEGRDAVRIGIHRVRSID